MNLSFSLARLDVVDAVSKRVILFDDGLHGDDSQDGLFLGSFRRVCRRRNSVLSECVNLGGQMVTMPGNPNFVSAGQIPECHAGHRVPGPRWKSPKFLHAT